MRRLAPLCLALAVALLGCSSGSGPEERGGGPAGTTDPSGTAAERHVSYTQRLPIARYSYTADEDAAIENAQHILTQRCMRTFGIDYAPPGREPTAPAPADRRYGLSSASEAERLGYHPDSGPLPTGPDLPEDALKVFYGNRGAEIGSGGKIMYEGKEIPENGCFGQAMDTLADEYDDPAGAAVARHISTSSYDESRSDPAVTAAFRKWSACMRNAGFEYDSPMDPLNSPAFQGEEISAEEKQTAVTDVECKEKTGLLDIWFKAETEIQNAGIKKDSKALEKLRTAHREKVDAARRIIEEG
ncbi:hypothetical protein ABZX40_09320 [Streptomyces sp. NPDC004610]|uniref:hypothetical protein n=1 Tax=unclassified Streptomyces TaxID=2593676 RepID=UPI0033A8968F